jgi:hypothetical protein
MEILINIHEFKFQIFTSSVILNLNFSRFNNLQSCRNFSNNRNISIENNFQTFPFSSQPPPHLICVEAKNEREEEEGKTRKGNKVRKRE